MSPTVISTLEEFHQAINSDKVAIIDFWATWCGPCRMISPVFEKLAEQSKDKFNAYKVDVDAAPEISQEVGIRAMPTFIAFKDGSKVDELVGADPRGLNALIAKSTAY